MIDSEHQMEVLQAVSTMKERPNRDALNRAVDIFRDAMRQFIVLHMMEVHDARVEDAILESLQGRRRDEVKWSLQQGKNIEDSIDVNDFPHIVNKDENWGGVFLSAFKGERAMKSTLGQIADARNKAVHPGPEDLSLEYVKSRLHDIADVLGRIDAPDEKQAVEDIGDKLPPGTGDSASPDQSSFWLNVNAAGVKLHKGDCGYVKEWAPGHPNNWTEYPTEEAARRSTPRTIQECGICF